MAGYDFAAIEKKWQKYWDENGTFHQPNPGEDGFVDRPKSYVLDMFPYPSGAGLHVGHPEGYTATDIVARYRRAKGFNVLHPMGYDSFGLPAEQYAVEHGVHPRQTTAANIANIERQIRMFGFSYDWSRRVATTEPDYYRWTQWIFGQMFHSWYDRDADAARPVEQLVDKLQRGKMVVDLTGNVVATPPSIEGVTGLPGGLIKFYELEPDEQRRVINAQRLAYMAEVPVNWCPQLGTVLANEEVTNEGRSERGDFPVYRRALRQWMLRITAYAERLLSDLDELDWPESIKIMQRNWIGKSTGADVDFPIAQDTEADDWFAESGFPAQPEDTVIRVFTTRPDTLFGATYMVLAPEHPLVEQITTDERAPDVGAYVEAAAGKSELERTAEAKEKTGVFTGAYAINPVNRERIPIWVADYVMMGYGTGAIMAVPAHDERDFEFARAFGLDIRVVVKPDENLSWVTVLWVGERPSPEEMKRLRKEEAQKILRGKVCFPHPGIAVNSGEYDGLPTAEFIGKITEDLEKAGQGKYRTNYKLRDWLFSRQRYWGEPFPIVHCPTCGPVAPPDHELPLELPEMEDFTPATSDDPNAPPTPPLAKATDWVKTTCPVCDRPGRRETNTMPQWAGSCWYYLRYLESSNDKAFVDPEIERYWMGDRGVDLYVGGAEHAVLHLLYARFWHKVLYDLGRVSTPEPFAKLFNQGMIRSFAYRDGRGVYVGYEDVDLSGDVPRHKATGEELAESVEKMSKSLKNVINPDEVIATHGADTFRLYEMFMGPLEASKPWNTRDVPGVHRFLHRVWRMIEGWLARQDDGKVVKVTILHDPNKPDAQEESRDESIRKTDRERELEVERRLNRVIKKVGEDIEAMKFNTAIAAMMEFVNTAYGSMARITVSQAERFVLVLAASAPHLAEELWQRLGHEKSLAHEPWPAYDEAKLAEQTVEMAVQVAGKIRGEAFTVPAGAGEEAVVQAALAEPKVAAAVKGKSILKKIVVPGRLVNLVVK